METDAVVTSDLSKFTQYELRLLEALLAAWREQGLPIDFHNENVTPVMNTETRDVFLTNADYQTAMLNRDTGTLETWYECPECEHEGFWEEFLHDDTPECDAFCRHLEEQRLGRN